MTKKEMFAEIRKIVADNAEMVAFIDHEIELLSKKSNSPRKPSKVQIENEGFKEAILATLESSDSPMSIRQLCDACSDLSDLSNQRVTHLLTALRKDGKVAREYVKKVPYFFLGSEEE